MSCIDRVMNLYYTAQRIAELASVPHSVRILVPPSFASASGRQPGVFFFVGLPQQGAHRSVEVLGPMDQKIGLAGGHSLR